MREHLAKYGAGVIAAADAYVAIIDEAGGRAEVAPTQGSIVATFDAPGGTLYPLALTRFSKGGVQLCLGYLMNRPAFAEVEVRQQLYDRFTEIVGPLTTKSVNGFPAFAVTKLNEPTVRERVAAFLRTICAMAERHDS